MALLTLAKIEPLFAENDLTLEQKNQKAQEFSQAIQDQVAETKAVSAAPPVKPWTLSIATNYGHNDNTSYDSRRKKDAFHQETITGTLQYDRPSLDGLIGPGKLGAIMSLDDVNYLKQNGSDSRNLKINPFVTVDLTQTLLLKAEYDFKSFWYIHNNSLSYHGHEFKLSLAESAIPQQIHKIYVSTEYDGYTRRKQLSASNTSLEGARADRRLETGYDFTFLASNETILGIAGAYQTNNSNDIFQDINDYQGLKITGFLYKVLSDRVSWVGAAGYDFKTYEHKLLPSSLGTERDEFIYAVSSLFIKLSPRTQLALTYFYDQNYSNDPILDFIGHTVTAGVTVTI